LILIFRWVVFYFDFPEVSGFGLPIFWSFPVVWCGGGAVVCRDGCRLGVVCGVSM
jgi:hypothetical protein